MAEANEHEQRQAELLDAYVAALARDRTAPPPDGLDHELTALVGRLGVMRPPEPAPSFAAELRRRLLLQAARAARPEATAAAAAEPVPASGPSPLGPLRRWLPLAAVLALVIGGGALLWNGRPGALGPTDLPAGAPAPYAAPFSPETSPALGSPPVSPPAPALAPAPAAAPAPQRGAGAPGFAASPAAAVPAASRATPPAAASRAPSAAGPAILAGGAATPTAASAAADNANTGRAWGPNQGLQLAARPDGGVEVAGVAEGSPAARAGILPGDRLTAIGGQPVADLADATRLLSAADPGRALPVDLQRGDEPLRVELLPGG